MDCGGLGIEDLEEVRLDLVAFLGGYVLLGVEIRFEGGALGRGDMAEDGAVPDPAVVRYPAVRVGPLLQIELRDEVAVLVFQQGRLLAGAR